jgi:hypothetical protein
LGAVHYSIAGLVPSLEPGRAGWCVTDATFGRVRVGAGKTMPTGEGAASCSYAPAVGRPIFAGLPGAGPGLHFYLAAPDVAAVRVNRRLTILTRADPELPFGLRAAVFQARFDLPFPDVVALDRNGHAIPTASQVLPAAPQITWLAPRPQPGGACSINVRAKSALHVYGGIAVRALIPPAGLDGRAFLSCVELELVDGPFSLEAALLLDAAHPGSPPAPLPGMRPVPGHPGWLDWPNPKAFPDGGDRGLSPFFFEATYSNYGLFDPGGSEAGLIPVVDGGLSARRVGNAWLVVQGGAGTAQRLAVLAALQEGRVQLRAPNAIARPTGARCWLKIRPLPGLTEVDEEKPDQRLQRSLGHECLVAATFYLGRWAIEAVFGSPDPPSAAVRPDLLTAPSPISTLRRGSGWLQITGGSGPAQRRELASAIQVVGP